MILLKNSPFGDEAIPSACPSGGVGLSIDALLPKGADLRQEIGVGG